MASAGENAAIESDTFHAVSKLFGLDGKFSRRMMRIAIMPFGWVKKLHRHFSRFFDSTIHQKLVEKVLTRDLGSTPVIAASLTGS